MNKDQKNYEKLYIFVTKDAEFAAYSKDKIPLDELTGFLQCCEHEYSLYKDSKYPPLGGLMEQLRVYILEIKERIKGLKSD